jgi:hypothetical protein
VSGQATALEENAEPEWILGRRDRTMKLQVNGKAASKKLRASY